MIRRLAALPAMVLLLAGFTTIGWSSVARASGEQLTYQVSDAEAYAYKASIPQPVVQAAPKCNPKTDKKFHCDTYDPQPNCPPKIAIGASALPADPQPPANVQGISGGAGDTEGQDPTQTNVPQSSSIRLHRLYANGQLGDASGILAANGLASLQYTDLGSPPWTNGYSHTETDAFTNQDNYEERCYATDSNGNYNAKASGNAKPGDSYAHFFSHSFTAPATDEFSECFQSQCQFYFGITASHGVSQLHLEQTGDTVRGVLSADLVGLQFPGGFPLEIKELQTYAEFESNGTADGLRWQAVTSAHGATLAGQPINLPTGKSFEFGQGDQAVAFGLSGPYVTASKDGSDLQMVAPGFFVATSQQTAFFAGAELTANFGKAAGAPVFPTQSSGGFGGGTSSIQPSGSTGGNAGVSLGSGSVKAPANTGSASSPSTTTQALPQSTLISKTDPPWAPLTIFGFGLLALLVVVVRWAQQFQWGRDLLTMRPVRGVEWLYRAFVKS
jgi:hypothetical protein